MLCLSTGSHAKQLLGSLKLGQCEFTSVYSTLGQPILSEMIRGKRWNMTNLQENTQLTCACQASHKYNLLCENTLFCKTLQI